MAPHLGVEAFLSRGVIRTGGSRLTSREAVKVHRLSTIMAGYLFIYNEKLLSEGSLGAHSATRMSA